MDCVQFFDDSVSVDNSCNIPTELYVKSTHTHQYLPATIYHSSHTKRRIPYTQALRMLRISSNIETAKLRCTKHVNCLLKRDYNKRKPNKQIERAFTYIANPSNGHQSHTTSPVHFNVQLTRHERHITEVSANTESTSHYQISCTCSTYY